MAARAFLFKTQNFFGNDLRRWRGRGGDAADPLQGAFWPWTSSSSPSPVCRLAQASAIFGDVIKIDVKGQQNTFRR